MTPTDARTRMDALLDRFFSKVTVDPDDPKGCWGWSGSTYPGGDGERAWFGINKNNVFAARTVFAWLNGPLMNTEQVCHTCDNPMCVNPDHLFIGTLQDNLDDMKKKGRGWWQKATPEEIKARMDRAREAQKLRGAYARGEAAHCHKLTEAEIPEIRRMLRDRIPQDKIAKAFGVTQTMISAIKRGKAWAHVPDEDQPKAA